MADVIDAVATKHRLPTWWVRAMAIEYTDCRDFTSGGEPWRFDFQKVSEADLEAALQSHKVALCGTVYHNLSRSVYPSRAAGSLVGLFPGSLTVDPGSLIPEGPVSPYHFLNPDRFPREVDPKLGFWFHFQALDDGRFWQWKIADFVAVPGRNRGKWISQQVNLDLLDEAPEIQARFKGAQFLQWLEDVRKPIILELEKIHAMNRASGKFTDNTTTISPPLLSDFEVFRVVNGKFQTRFFAAPVFFRACVGHVKKAEDLFLSCQDSEPNLVAALDSIYQESASAVMLGVACIEAFVNDLGTDNHLRFWVNIEKRLDVETKLRLLFELNGNGAAFNLGEMPYQLLAWLTHARNELMHPKGGYNRATNDNNKVVTALGAQLRREFVQELPSRLRALVSETCKVNGFEVPSWLEQV